MDKIKNILKKIFKNKKIVSFFVLFLLVGVFAVGAQAHAADVGSAVATILSWLIYPFIWIITQLILVLFSIFQGVLSYNDFINATPVVKGWAIVRDVCNMFFILILLVIAFATILRVEGYDIKKMLPKLIIMAILINFSKTICGLIIDAADLIMNTFVNAFTGSLNGNLTTMLGLPALGQFPANDTTSSDNPATFMGVTGTIILSLIFCLIALVVTVVLLAVLVVRMVMIWIYIVLSPLAYLLATFPQGQKYAKQWWDDFTKYVITGPILAFFLWLAFVTAGSTTNNVNSGSGKLDVFAVTNDGPVAGLTVSGTPDSMLKFVISIGMLIGGLIITQQAGGAIGGIAGGAMAKINGGAKWLQKQTVGRATNIATNTAKDTLKMGAAAGIGALGAGVGKVGKMTGNKSLQAAGKLGTAWGGGIVKNLADEKVRRFKDTMKKVGLGRADQQGAIKNMADSPLGKGLGTAKKVAVGAAGGLAASAVLGPAGLALGAGYGVVSIARHFMANGAKKKSAEYDDLSKTRDKKLADAEAEHNKNIQPYKQEFNQEKAVSDQANIINQQRDAEIKTAGKIHDDDLAKVKNDIRVKLEQAGSFPSGASEERKNNILESNSSYTESKKKIDETYDKKVESAKDTAAQRIKVEVDPIKLETDHGSLAAASMAKENQNFEGKKAQINSEFNSALAGSSVGQQILNVREEKDGKLRAVEDDNMTTEKKAEKRAEIEEEYKVKEENVKVGIPAWAPAGTSGAIKDYHPNKVVMDATKAIEELEKFNKQFADSIAGGAELFASSANHFYDVNGQSDRSKTKITALGSQPEALKNIVKQLKLLRTKVGGGSATEKKSLKDFLQGLAAMEKGGGDISSYRSSGVLDEGVETYNRVNSDNETISLESLKNKVVAKPLKD
jgi:TrbL/VirB6 plasmid conjugal transfer protein.